MIRRRVWPERRVLLFRIQPQVPKSTPTLKGQINHVLVGDFWSCLQPLMALNSTGLNFCFSTVFLSPICRALGRVFQLVQFCPPQLGLFHSGHRRFRSDASSSSYPHIYLGRKTQRLAIIVSTILEIFSFRHYLLFGQLIWSLCWLHTELRSHGQFKARRFCQKAEKPHDAVGGQAI